MLNTSKTKKEGEQSRFLSGETKLLIASVFCLFTSYMYSQGAWTQKASLGSTAKRFAGIGFSIGSKGYIGLGVTLLADDFWEWDQATNVWTQKANFSGGYRLAPVGFSIGNKGYIGTGSDGGSVYYNDFWEWDQATNVWVQKAPFGGAARDLAVGFSIGNKGYIGTGNNAATSYQDFWEWDQASNTWVSKANFGGGPVPGAVCFVIGTKGYVCGIHELWEWNQGSNLWTQKAAYPGPGILALAGFSIGTKGYIGTGEDFSGNYKNDFWEYDTNTNAWTPKANFGGADRSFAVGFSIGTKGYIGTGRDTSTTYLLGDLWEFDPAGSGVNEIDLSSSISVYPNPSSGKFTLRSETTKGDIVIYNVEGEKVYSTTLNYNLETIDLSSQPGGIYFVQIKTGQGIGIKKVVIQ